jgi:hypothetical protein
LSHERRPIGGYYEERIDYLSQGDLFADVPLAYPTPADAVVLGEGDDEESARRFLSGPFEVGLAMLITPTCSMRTQGSTGATYAHPVRTLVPIRPVTDLMEAGILDRARLGLAEKRDALINYMYLPAAPERSLLEESLALLYMPVTLHHEMIADSRITQLTYDAAAQLQKKLTWHVSSMLLERADFDPPMD